MGKLRRSNKESKKQAVLTPKERKAARQARKHASHSSPLLPR
jgi:hypothetical protein